MGRSPLELSFAEGPLDGGGCGGRVVHLNDQSGVQVVLKVNHNGVFWIVDVPEHALTLLIEGARRDYPRHVGARCPYAHTPTLRNFWTDVCAYHVGQGNL